MAISGTIIVAAAGTSVQAANKGNARSMVFKARNDSTVTRYFGRPHRGPDVSLSGPYHQQRKILELQQ
jgi:hypothetical protein